MTGGPESARRWRPRRADLVVGALAAALVGLSLALGPVALQLDPSLRVADAYYPWRSTPFGPNRLAIRDQLPPLPPDPWGRPWAERRFRSPTDDGACAFSGDPGPQPGPSPRGQWVVYSLGPDGKDDGGVQRPDVIVDGSAVVRVFALGRAPGAGAILAALLLSTWAAGRAGGRRRAVWHAGLVLVFAWPGAWAALAWLQSGPIPILLPEPPGFLFVSRRVAAILSLLAVLGLVAALGRATTRREAPRDGVSAHA